MLEKNHADTLTSKWEPILEGIDDQNVRESTAILLENQARHLLNEQMKETGVLSEAGSTTNAQTTVGSIGTFQKFAFPLVRRVFPELIANKIVGVQPMQGPVSQIFYLGYDRATDSRRQAIYSKYNKTLAKPLDNGVITREPLAPLIPLERVQLVATCYPLYRQRSLAA